MALTIEEAELAIRYSLTLRLDVEDRSNPPLCWSECMDDDCTGLYLRAGTQYAGFVSLEYLHIDSHSLAAYHDRMNRRY